MMCSRSSLFLRIIPSLVYLDLKSFILYKHINLILNLLRVIAFDLTEQGQLAFLLGLFAARGFNLIGDSNFLTIDVVMDYLFRV